MRGALVAKVTDVDVREYLEEALKSLSVDALMGLARRLRVADSKVGQRHDGIAFSKSARIPSKIPSNSTAAPNIKRTRLNVERLHHVVSVEKFELPRTRANKGE